MSIINNGMLVKDDTLGRDKWEGKKVDLPFWREV